MASEIYQDPRSGAARIDEPGTPGMRMSPIVRERDSFGDLVRWGPIVAGVFSAMAITAILTILGLAIGFSTLDPGDTATSFGIGAGIWSAATALVAFFFGGWIAARTAALQVESNGLLQGTMVWMVTVPLLIYFVAGGIGSVFRVAGNAVGTGVQAVAPEAIERAQPGQPPAGPGAQQPGGGVREQIERGAEEASRAARGVFDRLRQEVTPGRVQDVAEAGSRAAWGTLLSLLLGLGAAALGGYVGSREKRFVSAREDRPGATGLGSTGGAAAEYH